jgi:hypothetical protein
VSVERAVVAQVTAAGDLYVNIDAVGRDAPAGPVLIPTSGPQLVSVAGVWQLGGVDALGAAVLVALLGATRDDVALLAVV